MNTVKKFIKMELSNWKIWEVVWLVGACGIILALSLYWKESLMGIIAGVTGAACVILTGKGKLSSYMFGFVNVLLYAILAFQAKYYGEFMLNFLYYLPLQFWGFYMWNKNMNKEDAEVVKKSLSLKQTLIICGGVSVLTVVYGVVLYFIGGELPFVDSFSTVVSVVAMLLLIYRFSEQWLLWILCNIVTVVLWIFALFNNEEGSIAMILMWSVYLINSVVMYIKWLKDAKKQIQV